MAKKMFIPARLSKKADRWEIVFYQTNPATGLRQRFRETRDLNRIPDLKLREKEADREVKAINKALPGGYPFQASKEVSRTVFQAAELARDIKIKNSSKARSHTSYKSQFAVFADFLAKKNLAAMDVRDFSKQHVRQFIFWMRHEREWKRGNERHVGLSNKKCNDYQSSWSAMFNELVEEGIVEHNPFLKMKRLKPEDTKRRPYEDDERGPIFTWAWENDRRLFYACLLQFNCLIRGEALRDLRFSMFDFTKGVIVLPSEIEKNDKKAVKTIPSAILKYFTDPEFSKYPANWLVFGKNMKPHASVRIGPSMLNNRFQKAMKSLKASGEIADTTGLSFYSNKNAGITKMSESLPLVDIMDQAGHKDPKTTMIYRKKPDFNPALKGFEVPFL